MTEATTRRGRPIAWAASSILSALGVLALWQSGAIERAPAMVLAIIPLGLMVTAFVSRYNLEHPQLRASRRYIGRVALLMMFYLATLFLAEHLIDDRGLTGTPAALVAFLPGLFFGGIIWVFGALIVEEEDEFFRMLYVRQGLIATAISFTLAAIWGFLETYHIVEHVAAFWWPTIWCFGIGIGAVANKISYGTYGECR